MRFKDNFAKSLRNVVLFSIFSMFTVATPLAHAQQAANLACWYNSSGNYTGADSSQGTVGSITRTGSGDYAAGYLISAFDGNACPGTLPAGATRGTTVYLVRQDFSNCTNDNVGASSSNVSGAVTVFHMQSGPAKAVVSLIEGKAAPSTAYHFFHKCVRILGDIRTDGSGGGAAIFDLSPEHGDVVTFDMYPEGAPAGKKYQSVRMTF